MMVKKWRVQSKYDVMGSVTFLIIEIFIIARTWLVIIWFLRPEDCWSPIADHMLFMGHWPYSILTVFSTPELWFMLVSNCITPSARYMFRRGPGVGHWYGFVVWSSLTIIFHHWPALGTKYFTSRCFMWLNYFLLTKTTLTSFVTLQ